MNMMCLGSCEGVAGHDEQARGMVLQQERGVVELDFGGQGCDARLRGSGICFGSLGNFGFVMYWVV